MGRLFLFNAFFLATFSFGSMIEATCPHGTVPYQLNPQNPPLCYLFQNQSQNCLNASYICSQNYMTLVSIHDQLQNTFLSDLAKSYFEGHDSFWTGAHLLRPNTWYWNDGTTFDFTDWNKQNHQPAYLPNYNCGAMNIQDGTWFSDNYENFKQFVCVMEAPSPCPHGWTYNSRSGYCYFVKEGLASWEENEDWCFSQGGAHLASVHSDDENNFITNLINFSEGEGYICGSDQLAWIGLYTVTNQTTWRWTDNSLFDYTAWATCKPDNAFRGANCAVIQNPQVCRNCTINVGNLRSWSDAMCYDNYKFGVCKKLP